MNKVIWGALYAYAIGASTAMLWVGIYGLTKDQAWARAFIASFLAGVIGLATLIVSLAIFLWQERGKPDADELANEAPADV